MGVVARAGSGLSAHPADFLAEERRALSALAYQSEYETIFTDNERTIFAIRCEGKSRHADRPLTASVGQIHQDRRGRLGQDGHARNRHVTVARRTRRRRVSVRDVSPLCVPCHQAVEADKRRVSRGELWLAVLLIVGMALLAALSSGVPSGVR